MCARRPAPLQVSFPLYPNSTGLSAIDYRIADPYFAPAGADAIHSERLIRLPDVHVCYTPARNTPPPAAVAPILRNGHITLGCFNNFAKVSDATVALWARILRAIPDARLTLKWIGLDDGGPSSVLDRFARYGVAASRITALGFQPNQYDPYLDIDVSLDPITANGGTTTCDSLWMGVPVVTLVGATPFSRVGLCHLTNVGLPSCIAYTPDEYEKIIVGFACDPGELIRLRTGLREKVAASPLVDGARYTRNLEKAYREIWTRWCDQAPTTP
jgi:predicted O-linked N-acetylglucosamine transferase (SPINDLY family)